MQHKKVERLMLFAEVAKQGSFTKAAEILAISRGYLSSQIKHLEQELGYSLMIRSTRSLRLTAQGERVLTGMESVQQTLLDLERKADYETDTLEGTIRLTAPLQFSQTLLVDICSGFNRLHPGVKFEIECSYQSHNLVKDNFDFAFRATRQPPPNVIARKIRDYRRVLVAAPSYLEQFAPLCHPKQLVEHQCLSGRSSQHWQFNTGPVAISAWLASDENVILKEQAIKGLGLISVPDYFVAKEIKAGVLQTVLDDYVDERNEIYLLYPQLVQRSKRLSTFIEYVLNGDAKLGEEA